MKQLQKDELQSLETGQNGSKGLYCLCFTLYGTKFNFLNMGKVFCTYLYSTKQIRASKSLPFPGLQLLSRELAQAVFLVFSNLHKIAKVDCVLIVLKTFIAI